jgi:hypothetical protein
MKLPDKDIAASILRLNNNKDFQVFMEWVQDSKQGYLELLPMAGRSTPMIDPMLIAVRQGYCCCLQEIIEAIRRPQASSN